MQTLDEAKRLACLNIGIEDIPVSLDGRHHSTAVTEGRKGNRDGRILMFADGEGGTVYNWKTGESQTFFADSDRTLNRAQTLEQLRRNMQAIKAGESKRIKAKEAAQAKAKTLWQAATPATDANPYLSRKGVQAVASLREIELAQAIAILGYAPRCGETKLNGTLLLAPIKIAGALSTLEMIDGAGHKAAIYGGAKAGGYWASSALPTDEGGGSTIVIGEGVATVLSVAQCTGYLGIATLCCGNLEAVAVAMAKRYPKAKLVILPDLDKKTGEPNKHAVHAARLIGCLLAQAPCFTATPSVQKSSEVNHG